LAVAEAVSKDVILGIKVVVEVVVKVVVGPWPWPGEGAVTLAVVSIGLPSMGSLSSPIKKDAYIKIGLIIVGTTPDDTAIAIWLVLVLN